MEPKIDRVVLGPNGQEAMVSGPINWDDDEISATFGAAITQMQADGLLVLASGRNATPFQPSQARWHTEVEVVGGGQLQTGTCNGWATASVHEDSGYEAYPWEVDNLTIITQEEVVRAPGR